MDIRDATIDDLPTLRSVFRRASLTNVDDRPLFEEHPELLDLPEEAVREGRTRAAVVDGAVVGFATLAPGAERDAVELEDLFVDPDHMRRGIARALIADVRSAATASGHRRVEVDGNAHALAFYESVGFVSVGEVQLEHGTAIRMHLDLTA